MHRLILLIFLLFSVVYGVDNLKDTKSKILNIDTNLILNGDANNNLFGWDDTSNLIVQKQDVYWIPSGKDKTNKVFAGYGGDVKAIQSVDISSFSAQTFSLSGFSSGFEAKDSLQLNIVFKDKDKNEVGRFSSKKLSSKYRDGLNKFVFQGDVPQNSSSASIEINMALNSGTYADQILDDLDFKLFDKTDKEQVAIQGIYELSDTSISIYSGKDILGTTKTDKNGFWTFHLKNDLVIKKDAISVKEYKLEPKEVDNFAQDIHPSAIKIKDLEIVDTKDIDSRYIQVKQPKIVYAGYTGKKLSSEIDILDNIVFSADSNIKTNLEDGYIKDKYKLNVVNVASDGSLEVINKLKDSKINTGIVRGDILSIYNNALYGFEVFQNYGILCSTSESVLYVISKQKINSVYDLRGMKISVGKVSNIAQIYLNKILEEYGISSDVAFRGYDIEKSLKELKDDQIDLAFIFADPKYKEQILKDNLIISSMPQDMLHLLKQDKGLISYSYKVKNTSIQTFKSPNYLIAPLVTLDTTIAKKIKAVIDKFECYKKIQNIDPFYGAIHPEVKNAILSIRTENKKMDELNTKLNAVEISLFSKDIKNNETKYVYEVKNHSNFDSNITFDHYETKLFDHTAIKPRHVFKNFPKGVISLKGNKSRLISFIYNNNFTTKIKDTNVNLVFKDIMNKDNIVKATLNVGDE